MTGYPGMMAVGWNLPMARGFNIGAIALGPFRSHPYVVGRWGFWAFDHPCVWCDFDIDVLGFGLETSQYQGGTKERGKNFYFHSTFL